MDQRYTARKGKQNEKKTNEWERLQLARLLVVLAVFLAVVLGKRIYPARMVEAGERIIGVLSANTDMEAVFSQLGESITGESGVLSGLDDFCVEVFGTLSESEKTDVEETVTLQPEFPQVHSGLLSRQLEQGRVFEQRVESWTDPCADIPAVGTVLQAAEQSRTFPDGYTADKLSLGSLKTVSPVVGYLNSGYGYREHPINGKYCFHGGADISAEEGDSIGAFADGVVEYVGEDRSYGLYIQLDHGNGIKSFYAHCEKLCASQGQQVRAGETIATVGATGTATGPHLHLELKCGDLRVDPAYYVKLL